MIEGERNVQTPIELSALRPDDFPPNDQWLPTLLKFANQPEAFNLYGGQHEYLRFSVRKEIFGEDEVYTLWGELKVPSRQLEGRVCRLTVTFQVPADTHLPITAATTVLNQPQINMPEHQRTKVHHFFSFAFGYAEYLCQEWARYFNRQVLQREGTPIPAIEEELVRRGFTYSEKIKGSAVAELEKTYRP